MAKKKSSFSGKVRSNAEKTKASGSAFGYLNMPKGVGIYRPEVESRIDFDMMPYEVTAEHHPDRDDDAGIAVPQGSAEALASAIRRLLSDHDYWKVLSERSRRRSEHFSLLRFQQSISDLIEDAAGYKSNLNKV